MIHRSTPRSCVDNLVKIATWRIVFGSSHSEDEGNLVTRRACIENDPAVPAAPSTLEVLLKRRWRRPLGMAATCGRGLTI